MIKRLEKQVEQRLESGSKEITTKLLNDISFKCFPFTMYMDFKIDEVQELQGRILRADIPPNLLLRARYELQELGMKPKTIESFRNLLVTTEEYDRYFASGKYTYEYDETKLRAEQALTQDERIENVSNYIEKLKKEEQINDL